MLRILLAQINLHVGDIRGNSSRVIEAAIKARDEQNADVILFPELTLTGYPPEDLLLRPEFIEQTERALNQLIESITGIVVIIGYPKQTAVGLYNSAAVIKDGSLIASYDKQLLPNYSVFDEKRYFTAGKTPCVFKVKDTRLGISICEDIWYLGPVTQTKDAGAELLLNLNASPYHRGKMIEREDLVGKRARQSAMPIVYANLVGGQDELVFDGGSFVVDAKGELVMRAEFFKDDELLIESDGTRLQPQKITPRPSEEAEIYQALVLGTGDYVRKNGFKGCILGLSGGIDSALTLAIAVDALGPDDVEAISMPSRYTSTLSNTEAQRQAQLLGVSYRSISIEPAFKAFRQMLQGEAIDLRKDVIEENIQARCRGIILMALSNRSGKILLTTGNKSEMAVGYATLYGDMAGGYAPLKDVPKTLVYRLAKYRNSLSEAIPKAVIDRAPSAELLPDQKDSDSLPDYADLDAILDLYVEKDQSLAKIIQAGYDAESVKQVAQMVDVSEYKRRQAPPGVRITRRAFGRDRRYPITHAYKN